MRSESPTDPFTDFWTGYEAHMRLMEKHQFKQTAALLRMYEQERQRQKTAIKNLEDQLKKLAQESIDVAMVRRCLEKAGIDVDMIVRTEQAFGVKP